MPETLTIEEMTKRISARAFGCGDTVGGFYEVGSKHRWTCGDPEPDRYLDGYKRKPTLHNKRLCYNCRQYIGSYRRRILKLEGGDKSSENSKAM